ncbi:MAG: hypothetical protein ACOZCF_01255 [Bacillota bacterium]
MQAYIRDPERGYFSTAHTGVKEYLKKKKVISCGQRPVVPARGLEEERGSENKRHVHAAFMQATIWTVNRFPPDLSRANDYLLIRFDALKCLAHERRSLPLLCA